MNPQAYPHHRGSTPHQSSTTARHPAALNLCAALTLHCRAGGQSRDPSEVGHGY